MKPATKLTSLTPALHGWAAFHTEWKVAFNSYAIRSAAGVVLVDPTKPEPTVLSALESLGEPVAIILTNAHHCRDAEWFRKKYSVQIYAHEKAAPDCDAKPDVPVMDGEKLPGGLKAIFLPGVSTSEMALYAKDGAGAMLIGDAILNTPGKGLELLPDQFIEDKKLARQSLQKLLAYDFAALTFGHGDPLPVGGKQALANFLKPRRPSRSSSAKAR
jgi:glyoxylase-like metal-dependent hydrolase (beta-lactamase superfamily II)